MKPKPTLHQQAKGFLFKKAIQLRQKTTPAEAALWIKIKARQLLNYKFRQQHPIGNYIADFYCHQLKLVIEVDGGYHFTNEQIEKDKFRDTQMINNHLHVLRLTNEEVMDNIDTTLEKIKLVIREIEEG